MATNAGLRMASTARRSKVEPGFDTDDARAAI